MANEISGQPRTPFLNSFPGLNGQKSNTNFIQNRLNQQAQFATPETNKTGDSVKFGLNPTPTPTTVPTAPNKAPTFSPMQQHSAQSLLFAGTKTHSSPTATFSMPTPTPSAKFQGLQTADAIEHTGGQQNQGGSEGSNRQ